MGISIGAEQPADDQHRTDQTGYDCEALLAGEQADR
jgi:hypothetical protein